MISMSELRRASAKLNLGLAQAEHEYVLLCALDGLTQTPQIADAFALKGGTALRQLYFGDWRHSVDLDFSVLPTFHADTLSDALSQWFAQIEMLHGISITLSDLHRPNGAARARARFIGPLDHPNRLLLDITLDEIVLLPLERRPIVTGLFTEPCPQVLVYSLSEILAEKMRAMLQRGKSRDYYDVWRLLTEKRAEIDQDIVCPAFLAKCAHRGPTPTRWSPISFGQGLWPRRRPIGTAIWPIRSGPTRCPHGLGSSGNWSHCLPGYSAPAS